MIYGDWGKGKQMRNFISTPMIGLKRKLSERFKIYTIDEYKTSCINHKTQNKNENLYLPDKNGVYRKIHSVLTYQMENKRYGCINRDINSVKNMRNIAQEWIEKRKRPEVFSRKKETKNKNHSIENQRKRGSKESSNFVEPEVRLNLSKKPKDKPKDKSKRKPKEKPKKEKCNQKLSKKVIRKARKKNIIIN